MSSTGSIGVTYLPATISSDAGYADLPLALLGAPVDIGALVKTWVTVSCEATQDRDWQAALPGVRDRTTCIREKQRFFSYPNRYETDP